MVNFIRRTFPGHLERNVPVNKELEIIFFVDLNKHEITSDKIKLFNLTEEKSIPIKYRYYNRKLSVKSIEPLQSNMHYQLQLIGGPEGIVDITGAYMAESYSFEFFTSSEKRITAPVITSPIHMSEVRDSITFEWQPVEDAQYYELEVSRSNTFHNLEWPSEEIKIFETKITPHIEYKKGSYYIRVRAVSITGIKSDYSKTIHVYYDGPSKESFSHVKGESDRKIKIETSSKAISGDSFLDQLQEQFSSFNVNEKDAFKLVNSTPKNQSSNLKSAEKIVLIFNDQVNEDSVTSETVYVLKERT